MPVVNQPDRIRPFSLKLYYQMLDKVETLIVGFTTKEHAARAIEQIRTLNASDMQFAQVYLSPDESDTALITRENLLMAEIIETQVMFIHGITSAQFERAVQRSKIHETAPDLPEGITAPFPNKPIMTKFESTPPDTPPVGRVVPSPPPYEFQTIDFSPADPLQDQISAIGSFSVPDDPDEEWMGDIGE